MALTQGDSSGDERDAESSGKSRCMCGQLVWACPREYPEDAAERRRRKWLIPADLSKEEFGLLFKDCCAKVGLAPNICNLHVFDEPHKRYNKRTGVRERHKHLLFKMKMAFAHIRLQKEFAARGVYTHFSFNLVGYVAYLQYFMVPSAGKLAADLDPCPWSFRPVPTAALLELCRKPSAQMEARNRASNASVTSTGGTRRGPKRKFMTFSEMTDAFVEAGVRTGKDAWMLAKSRKVAGDDVLFNTLGSTPCVDTLVAKITRVWQCESMPEGTLKTSPDHKLSEFIPIASVSPKLIAWMQGGWKKQTLVLCGKGNLGKTDFACALAHAASSKKTFHFINKLDRVRDIVFVDGEALVYDEAFMADRRIDDVKAFIDLEKGRDVSCRNRDGHIPKGMLRIMSTNWPKAAFFPKEASHVEHADAIERRVLWIDVKRDIRRGVAAAVPMQDGPDEEDEDPFDYGFGMEQAASAV